MAIPVLARNGKIIGAAAGGGQSVQEITQTEYDALSDEEKALDIIYLITDAEGGGGGGVSGNVRYNSVTDSLQVLYNGEWTDIMKCNLNRNWLFNNGVFKNQDIIEIKTYGSTINNNCIYETEARGGIWTNNMVEGVTKIYVEIVTDADSCYIQRGTCTSEASLPTIIAYGTARTSYAEELLQAGITKTYVLNQTDVNSGIFIGGDSANTFHITKIWYE